MFMIRKQWYEGSTHNELKTLIERVAGNLMVQRYASFNKESVNIGGGLVALRDDLGIGRLSMALLNALSEPPFDEVVEADDYNCDINEHGIFEINMLTWDTWELNHYNLPYETDIPSEKRQLAIIMFRKGEPFPKGMKIDFKVSNGWEYGE